MRPVEVGVNLARTARTDGVARGMNPRGLAWEGQVLFYNLYYVMTGLHGLHLLIGIVLLTVVAVLVSRGKIHKSNFVVLENSGLYWHLVDMIWIYLFPLFYLISKGRPMIPMAQQERRSRS